jgi:hypothetical protein
MEEHVPYQRSRHTEQQNRFKIICARVAGLIYRPRRRFGQRGQALVEYMLVLIIAFTFTHQVFFNPKFGFKGVLQKTMLRIGSFLEQNLKSGTKVGGTDGKLSLDPYAGTDRWSN